MRFQAQLPVNASLALFTSDDFVFRFVEAWVQDGEVVNLTGASAELVFTDGEGTVTIAADITSNNGVLSYTDPSTGATVTLNDGDPVTYYSVSVAVPTETIAVLVTTRRLPWRLTVNFASGQPVTLFAGYATVYPQAGAGQALPNDCLNAADSGGVVAVTCTTATVLVQGGPVYQLQPSGGVVDAAFSQGISGSGPATITHALGKHPAVTVVDTSGFEFLMDVQHLSVNQVQLSWAGSFSGTVYCN